MIGSALMRMATTVPQDPFGWIGGTVAGKYKVLSIVAEGGFGVVYRAQHLGFDTPIALKCLKVPSRLQGQGREEFLRAFVEEGRLLHQLSRANAGIVQALDVGAETAPSGDWTPYLALEWLEGKTLEEDFTDRQRAGTPGRPLAEAIALLEPAARALAVAHERGIAHRDIKPANLFLTEVGGKRIVKVVDFGIAKVMTEVTSITQALRETGQTMQAFTPQYGAPEQFDRKRYGATGPWTDVFSLALVFVEVLSGRFALDGGDTTQLFISAVHPARRPTPRGCGVLVPDAVEAVMTRAVSVEPRDRFHSAGELWDALVAAAAGATSPDALAATRLSTRPPPGSSDVATSHAGGTKLSAGVDPGGDLSRAPTELAGSGVPLVPRLVSAPPPQRVPSVSSTPAPVRPTGSNRLVVGLLAVGGLASVLALFGGIHYCARPPSPSVHRPGGDRAIGPALSSLASAIAAAAASAGESPYDPTPVPGATSIAVVQPDAKATGAWLDGYAVYRVAGSDGLPFLGAQRACTAKGLVLCTAAQWRRACDREPEVAAHHTWTSELNTTTRAVVTRGGQSCTTESDVAPSAARAELDGLCCSRAVAVVGAQGDVERARRASDRIAAFEAATNSGDAQKVASLFDIDARFFLLKDASREQIRAEYEDKFLKHPDLWQIHDSCELRPPDGDAADAAAAATAETLDCHTLAQQDGKAAVVVDRFTWDGQSGKLRSVYEPRVLLPAAPIAAP
jgi:serine/threonine protein kinase